ncbi:MAG: cysteine desulfurase family protein [Candidatus Moraniibacteriota bacterium]
MDNRKIYLDYAATTPVDAEVLKTMLPYFSEEFGNASSLHSFGRIAADAVFAARESVANFFKCSEEEIIFTSGATESNNLAIKGVLRAYNKNKKNSEEKPHIITTVFEHSCVLKICQKMEKEGSAEVTYLPVYANGIIKVSDVEKALKENTILVSIMYVNNEIGTVQPIAQIGKIIKKHNSKILDTKYQILFHTDATQAVAYFDTNVKRLGVDLLSMSAHKIYGPKGVGILYVKKGTKITQIQDGGAQEFALRAGTLNSTGIIGLGKAIEVLEKSKKKEVKKIKELRDYLIKKVLKEIPSVRLNGSRSKRSPNNANFSFSDVEGESLLLYLDADGIAASTGSACSSGSLSPSHVLLALGLKPEQAHGSLRVSLGKYTTKKELVIFVTKLKKVLEKLRKVSGEILKEYYSKKK